MNLIKGNVFKLAVVCILCTLLVCGCATAMPSPYASSYGNTTFWIELEGDIGTFQDLKFTDITLITNDGYVNGQGWYWLYDDGIQDEYAIMTNNTMKYLIYTYLPFTLFTKGPKKAGLKYDIDDYRIPENLTNESFKKLELTFILFRQWGFCGSKQRNDLFHLDVTNLYEIPSDHVVYIPLKISHSYKCFKSDSVTITDRNNNKLIYFPPTRQPAWLYPWN